MSSEKEPPQEPTNRQEVPESVRKPVQVTKTPTTPRPQIETLKMFMPSAMSGDDSPLSRAIEEAGELEIEKLVRKQRAKQQLLDRRMQKRFWRSVYWMQWKLADAFRRKNMVVSESAAAKSESASDQAKTEPGNQPYTRDFLFALLSALVAQGYAMSGFPPKIVFACALWVIALSFVSHALWAWLRSKNITRLWRSVTILVISSGIAKMTWSPVLDQYRKENPLLSKLVSAEKPERAVPRTKPANLHELFLTDFPLLIAFRSDLAASIRGEDREETKFEATTLIDIDANTQFLSLYFPRSENSFDLIKSVGIMSKTLINEKPSHVRLPDAANVPSGTNLRIENKESTVDLVMERPGDTATIRAANLNFSGVVYIYHENDFSLEQLGQLETEYKRNKLTPQFRGQKYATSRWLQEKAK